MFADLLFHFCWCVSSSTFQAEITCWNLLRPGFRNRPAVHVLSCPGRLFSLGRILIYEGSLFQSCFHHVNMRYIYLAFALKSEWSRASQSKTQQAEPSYQSFPSKLKISRIQNYFQRKTYQGLFPMKKYDDVGFKRVQFTSTDEKMINVSHLIYVSPSWNELR